MRDRHWDQLSIELNMDLHPDSSFTLAKAKDMGLLAHLETVARVSDVAEKEFGIEQVLAKMQGEWECVKMNIVPYRETGTFVMKVDEQTMQQLDDHIGEYSLPLFHIDLLTARNSLG